MIQYLPNPACQIGLIYIPAYRLTGKGGKKKLHTVSYMVIYYYSKKCSANSNHDAIITVIMILIDSIAVRRYSNYGYMMQLW